MKHIDKTGIFEDEKVNVNGTIYMLDINSSYNKPPDEKTLIQYIKEQYKVLLEKYPNLKVTLIESDISSFQDFCIELRDGVDLEMAPVIKWWLARAKISEAPASL